MEIQFGSEEYTLYSGDPSGLGFYALAVTVDGALIWLVPDGAVPFSAKSIHPFLNEGDTRYTENPALDSIRGHLYLNATQIDSEASPGVRAEYNGMTVRFRLHAFVSPGLHKVRVAIADRDYSDSTSITHAGIDSGVFIRGGSIRTVVPTP